MELALRNACCGRPAVPELRGEEAARPAQAAAGSLCQCALCACARNSVQGTRQLDADISALAAVFGQYTSRPGAHFKETKEACK